MKDYRVKIPRHVKEQHAQFIAEAGMWGLLYGG